MTEHDCGAVILAGGTSRRMGRCKATLTVDGESMLDRTRACLIQFDEILLSVGVPPQAELPGVRCVRDRFCNCGPLSGIHATLLETEKDALLYVPCDLPYLTVALPKLLLAHMPQDADAFVCRDSTGGIHPLCGIYRKRVLPALEAELAAGQCRVMQFLRALNWRCLDTVAYLPDRVFLNMNAPEVYRAVCARGETV